MIMENNQDIKDQGFKNFEDYHNWYISFCDTPFYSKQWPVILAQGSCGEEIIEDGWHRFHSYIRDGIKSIPFVLYIKKD